MRKVLRYGIVGVGITLFDYLTYTLMVMVVFRGNTEFTWVAAMVSGVIATLIGYVAHSKITWKTRDPGKFGIIKFVTWNVVGVLMVRPVLARLFGMLTGLYQAALAVCEFLRLPFNYDFVKSTGVYVLMMAVMMVLNFMIYERWVFGAEKAGAASKGGARSAGRRKRTK